ncbi:MAG: 4Fe-4S binding protein, partial [Actinobacteria bacterium]|nr:4Fe-4S binding protein [Actinomycetota bacterium]
AITQSCATSLPEYSQNKCIGCGQCLSACPLEAFVSPNFTESYLLNRLAGDQPLRIRCSRAVKALEVSVSDRQTYDLEVCFAALSPGCLFELAHARECVFDFEHCQSCPLYESERETMRINFLIAHSLLFGWGIEGHLSESSGALLSDEETLALISCDSIIKLPAMKKSLIGLRARFYGTQTIKSDLNSPALFKTMIRHAPIWRMRLAREWKRLEATGKNAGKLLWPQIEVAQERCRACGTCMQFCPTGAIVHTIENDAFAYSYLPGLCVDCGLCVASCSNNAVRREYETCETPFTRSERFSKSVRYCARCKSPFINDGGSNLCLWCSIEPDFNELIEYSKTKMHFNETEVKGIH